MLRSLASDFISTRLLSLYKKPDKKLKTRLFEVPLFLANLFFVFVAIVGQVGQNVSLPLWINSTNENPSGRAVDGFFFLSFSSLSFVVIFGLCTLLIKIFSPKDLGESEKRLPHSLVFLIGLCDALNGVLVVYASKGWVTLSHVNTVFLIPLTLLLRILIMHKKPTCVKLACCIMVVAGTLLCFIPTIFPEVESNSKNTKHGPRGVFQVLRLILCLLGCGLTTATVIVLEEKVIKKEHRPSRRRINLIYFLFCASLYQLLCVLLFFWVDFLPLKDGNDGNMQELARNWRFGVQCFFGGAGCESTSGTRGTVCILMYVFSYLGGVNLLRHAEGATWLAIVTAFVTPLGCLLSAWFHQSPFKWQSEDHMMIRYCIGALVIMAPAIFAYNMGPKEISLNSDESDKEESTELINTEPGPEQPLLCDSNNASFKLYHFTTLLR